MDVAIHSVVSVEIEEIRMIERTDSKLPSFAVRTLVVTDASGNDVRINLFADQADSLLLTGAVNGCHWAVRQAEDEKDTDDMGQPISVGG